MQTDENMEKAYGACFANDFDYCDRLRHAVLDEKDGYAMTKALLDAYTPVRAKPLPAAKATDNAVAYKQMRDGFTKKLTDLRDNAFSKSPENIRRAMKDTAKNLYILYIMTFLFNCLQENLFGFSFSMINSKEFHICKEIYESYELILCCMR